MLTVSPPRPVTKQPPRPVADVYRPGDPSPCHGLGLRPTPWHPGYVTCPEDGALYNLRKAV